MLLFKEIELSDYETIAPLLADETEQSCENTFVNLLIWQKTYQMMWAMEDGQLVIKNGEGAETAFALPYGDDFEKGFALIREYTGETYPDVWSPDGERFRRFRERLGEHYVIAEERDAFDYLYRQRDLAELAGKKYHGKRNHLHSFDKKYEWHFEPICEQNTEAVLRCAERWYTENGDRMDQTLAEEQRGVTTMLMNREKLGVRGGAIFVGQEVAAFTLGSPVNDSVFDIHIEKSLPEYEEGYTVINYEFAKTLVDYPLINREDDMGIEGLRKAKLSYHPVLLLPKYFCRAKEKP